jgi:hypothetical protein
MATSATRTARSASSPHTFTPDSKGLVQNSTLAYSVVSYYNGLHEKVHAQENVAILARAMTFHVKNLSLPKIFYMTGDMLVSVFLDTSSCYGRYCVAC